MSVHNIQRRLPSKKYKINLHICYSEILAHTKEGIFDEIICDYICTLELKDKILQVKTKTRDLSRKKKIL